MIGLLGVVSALVIGMALPALADEETLQVTADNGVDTVTFRYQADPVALVTDTVTCWDSDGNVEDGPTALNAGGGYADMDATYAAVGDIVSINCKGSYTDAQRLGATHYAGAVDGFAGGFMGSVAGEAWPIALAIFTALIGITLGVGVLRFILAKGRSLARGG